MDEKNGDNKNKTSNSAAKNAVNDDVAQESAEQQNKDAKKHVNSAQNGKNEEDESAAELKERLLRLAAEFDNYKKRTANELMQAKDIGSAEFAKSLLTIIDEFELTLIATQESNDKNLAKGVELVYANFIDTLKKLGLKEISTDKGFDPYIHEIVMVKDDDSKEGTIIEVIKKGYTFKERILRPSSVIISKGKPEQENADDKK